MKESAFQLIFTSLHLWAASLHLAAARYHALKIKPLPEDTYLAALERKARVR